MKIPDLDQSTRGLQLHFRVFVIYRATTANDGGHNGGREDFQPQMQGAKFHGCLLGEAGFEGTDLSQSRFENVNRQRAVFTNVNMSNVVIDDANVEGLLIFGWNVADLIREALKRKQAGD